MSELKAVPGEFRATINVTRKVTGKVDTYELVGHSDPAKLAEILARRGEKVEHGAFGAVVGAGPALAAK